MLVDFRFSCGYLYNIIITYIYTISQYIIVLKVGDIDGY